MRKEAGVQVYQHYAANTSVWVAVNACTRVGGEQGGVHHIRRVKLMFVRPINETGAFGFATVTAG